MVVARKVYYTLNYAFKMMPNKIYLYPLSEFWSLTDTRMTGDCGRCELVSTGGSVLG